MTVFLVSLVAAAGFAAGLWLSGIAGTARGIILQANTGLSAMLDSALCEDEKEVAVRRAGLRLILGSGSILWRLILCLLAAAAPVWLAERADLAPAQDVMGLMVRLDYILGVSLALIGLAWWRTPRRRGAEGVVSRAGNGIGDRFLHMLAFSGPGIQKAAARAESALFGKAAARVPARPPVLVTSLARGGTTAVLNALNDLPETVTLTYREMPFVTAPLLWGRLSAPLNRRVETQTRAHGDGLGIDLDSPEAFDEVYWRLFWPGKYKDDRIDLWTAKDLSPEATTFFTSVFRRMVLLRRRGRARYLSKNNANVARLRLLPEMFPGCDIVIPLRRPAAHAASLLRQHENFLARQAEDDFTRRYMRDIGHLEFGLLQRPMAFAGFEAQRFDARAPDYWLAYWIAAFEEVRRHLARCHLVTQDDLRAAPVPTMQALCHRLKMDSAGIDFARYFHSAPDRADRSLFDPALLDRADRLYADLALSAVKG